MRPSHAPSRSRSLSNWILLLLLLLTASGSAQTPWVQSHRLGNEVRFLYSNLIRRYDLATRSWLPDVTLPRSGATAFTGDNTGNAVAYGTSIYLYNPAWASELASDSANSPISHIFLDGSLLIAVHSSGLYGRITTINRGTGTVITTKEAYVDSMYGASHAPGINRLYGRTSGTSPADIVSASYTAAGAITGPAGSPYHGTYPAAQQTFVFPDERRVVDSSGTVYTSDSLTFAGSFGGTITDIDWNGDVPIVLRGTDLIAFRNTITETARVTIPSGAAELAVTSSDAFLFRPTTSTPTVQIVPLAALNAPNPGEPIDPNGLPFTADDAFIDKDGIIHLYNKAQMAFFRWSPAERRYLPTISLPGAPAVVSYSAPNHTVYSLYSANPTQLRKLDLTPPSPQEALFASLPSAADSLTTAGDMTLTANWDSRIIHSANGTVLDNTFVGSSASPHTFWDPVRRRMYRLGVGVSLVYESISADGKLTGTTAASNLNASSLATPILVSPDGNRIVIGSGGVFNPDNLTLITTLPNSISDGVWKNDTLITLRLINGLTQLQTWIGHQFSPGPSVRQFPGSPVNIFNSPSGIVVITSVNGIPRFSLLDDSFTTTFTSPAKPLAPGIPSVTSRSFNSVSLSWPDLSDNETSFRIDFRPTNDPSPWSQGATAVANATSATITGLLPNTPYDFRIVTLNDALVSNPSPSASTRTLASPEEPTGEPYNLAVTRIFHNSITIAWSDNASNESGFRILRSLSPGGPATTFILPPNSSSFTDNNLSRSTAYFYRVQAFNGPVDSELSAEVAATTDSSARTPTPPSSFNATEVTATSARLSWVDHAANEDSFSVERSSFPAGTWTTAAILDFNTRTFVLNNLSPDTAYSIRIRITNSSGSALTNYAINFTTLKIGGEFTGLAQQFGTTYHFAFRGPNRLERYNLTTRRWLDPIPMSATATALWIDDSGIYAAEGPNLIRWNLNGSSRSIFFTNSSPITGLFTIGNVLVTYGSGYTSLDKSSGNFLTTFAINDSPSGFSVDRTLNRALFRTIGERGYTGDIHFLDIGPDGRSFRSVDSPYAGVYPSASRTFVFPRGGRVVDDSGSVYSTEGLIYLKSLGAAFTDLAFHGSDVPIVLRGNRLSALTNLLNESGSVTLPFANGQRVAVTGTDAIVFFTDASTTRGLDTESVPLASLNPTKPDQPINPTAQAYPIDDAFLDKNNDLLLLAKADFSVFRWSPSLKSYTAAYPLAAYPTTAAYSPLSHRLFTAYASNTIRQLDLTQPSPAEAPFASLPWSPRGLAAAGEFLFASANRTVSILSPSGATLSAPSPFTFTSAQNTWDPVRRRIYHFRDGTSPDDLHFDNLSTSGTITAGGESPYQGNLIVRGPIRVSSDGNHIALGSGEVLSATDLTRVTTLPVTATDMVWKNYLLVTIEPESSTTHVKVWDRYHDFVRTKSVALGGSPLRIFSIPSGGFAVITRHSTGVPRFHLLDDYLKHTYDSIPTPPTILRQPRSQRLDFREFLKLEVLASGSPSLSYQWYFNNALIPGATSPSLQRTVGSLDAGAYRVSISDGTFTVSSSNAIVSVGPPTPQFLTPGALLVSSGGVIREIRTNGILNRSITVPVAPGTAPAITTARNFDVTIDTTGHIHVLNLPSGITNPVFHLSSYDPTSNTWIHTPLPNLRPSDLRDANLAIDRNSLTVSDGILYRYTDNWRTFPGPWFPDKIAVAAGKTYGMTRSGRVGRLEVDFSSYNYYWSNFVNLSNPGECYGFTVDSSGGFITGNSLNVINAFSPSGTRTGSLTLTSGAGTIQDMNLSPDGTLAIGHSANFITLVQPGLGSPTRIPITNNSSNPGTFVTWIPSLTPPSPFLWTNPPPPATEDRPWQWSPGTSHMDPDAVLTFSAISLPSWLRLENGSLSGTPLASHVGTHSLRIKVTDAFGRSAEQSYSLSVTAVNDTPIALNRSLDRPEDSPAESILLSDLISDEESTSLTWSITGTTGSAISADLSDNLLRISYLPNAHGTATVRIRGTDAGGSFAESLVTINVSPVNDAPTGSLPPIFSIQNSPPVSINLADSFADIESPVSALSFSFVSSGPDIAAVSLNGSTLTISPRPDTSGSSTITVRASDPEGLFVDVPLFVTISSDNITPVIPAAIPDISASDSAADQLISFASLASDPDVGEVLTWRITANSNPALFSSLSFDAQGRLAIRYAPYVSGTATITVSVTDRFGASAQRSFNITVPPLPAPAITSQTPPSFNPLTGLWELPVTIQNIAQRAIGGFSLSTSSLPQGTSLYNTSNAVSPSPSITDARPLNPNQSITLTLEFLHPSEVPLPAPTLSTTTTLPRPTPPATFAIVRASFPSPESLLLEFPSEPGTLYQIQYSNDGINWLDSLARIRAAGTSTQWFDSGSPRTSSPPGAGSRFYRVKRL